MTEYTFETIGSIILAKRRISNKEVKGIAKRRMTILMSLAHIAAINGKFREADAMSTRQKDRFALERADAE